MGAIDTAASSSLETETFTSSMEYDALSRPTSIIRPDSSEILPIYNEAGMLESVDVKIRGAATATTFISDINYNEKGQRTKIIYGNGARTKYTYNTQNFRLSRILTTRNSGADILQDLNYYFDPVGNITEMQDDAQQTHYFQNSVVSPNGKYEYDALYRLTKATGREHYGQGQIGNSDFPVNTPVPQNNNATAVENYTESYEYDEIGNILKLIHQATSGNWTRGYHYDTSTSNHLLKTSVPGDTIGTPATYSASYTHDAHGNMTSMPHLSSMIWDYQDRLREVDLGGGGTAWYVYDAQGTRVRKVIENGTLKKDRIYLDEINEYYREYISGSKDYERETLHIMDDRKRLAIVETKTWDSGSAVVTPSPVIRYQFDNHLGSASLELDTSANIISYDETACGSRSPLKTNRHTEQYHPFGTSSYRLGSSVSEVSLKRYRYVGKERDDESGLYYYGARYYAAWLCRFVSVDPLKDDYPYYTPFQYAGNKPITFIDLDGLEEEKVESTEPKILFWDAARDEASIPYHVREKLLKFSQEAGLVSIRVNRVSSSPEKQVTVMFNDLEDGTEDSYLLPGQKVQKVYRTMKADSTHDYSNDQIKAAMLQKMIEVGPSKVSNHVQDDEILAVDISISQIPVEKREAFEKVILKAEEMGEVERILYPGNNSNEDAYHIEFKKKSITELLEDDLNLYESLLEYFLEDLMVNEQKMIEINDQYSLNPTKELKKELDETIDEQALLIDNINYIRNEIRAIKNELQ